MGCMARQNRKGLYYFDFFGIFVYIFSVSFRLEGSITRVEFNLISS